MRIVQRSYIPALYQNKWQLPFDVYFIYITMKPRCLFLFYELFLGQIFLKEDRIIDYFYWSFRSGSVSRKSFRECGPPAPLPQPIKAAGSPHDDPTTHETL